MTTAKPQEVNDQPEAADDLIAELAKLMAQDAQGDRKDKAPEPEAADDKPAQGLAPVVQQSAADASAANPAAAAPPPFAFRLPGDVAPTPRDATPAPRFDFSTTSAPAPTVPSVTASGSPAPLPPEPFAFDFGLNGPAPVATPQAFEEAHQADAQESQPAGAAAEQDAIGDLIAAEFSQATDEAEDESSIEAEAEEATAQPVPPPVTTTSIEPQLSPSQPRAREPSDDFAVSPVFGLGGSTQRVEPVAPVARSEPMTASAQSRAANQDPISDIESLIGDAVRIQREPVAPRADVEPKGSELRVNASPALRSLATPVLPQSPAAARSVHETEAMSAEDTILAAAEATGAQVGWAERHEAAPDFEPAAIDEEPRARVRRGGSLRAFAGPAVAVALLLAAGIGLYSVLGLGGNDGPAPLLTADAGPAKEVPETAADAEPEPQSVVFSEIAGTATPAEDEQLVSRDQSQATDVAALPTDEASAEGLVNRKVRTVTVRPDGTIVGGEDSVAGAAMLPVDRPNVPEVPGAEQATRAITTTEGQPPAPVETQTAAASPTATAGAATGQTGTDAADPVAELIATAPADSAAPATDPAAPASATADTPAISAAASGATAPVPMPRIERPSAPSSVTTVADTPSQPVNAVVQGTLQPVATQAPAQQAAVNQQQSTAPAYVQLSSQRSQEDAEQTAANLQGRYGNLFGGGTLEIQRVDLGERGIYYRVRLPAQSLENATQICNSVKAGGGDCFTL